MAPHLNHLVEMVQMKGHNIWFYEDIKPYVVAPHLNHLVEMVQMKGHNIWFYEELTKIISNYPQILPLI